MRNINASVGSDATVAAAAMSNAYAKTLEVWATMRAAYALVPDGSKGSSCFSCELNGKDVAEEAGEGGRSTEMRVGRAVRRE